MTRLGQNALCAVVIALALFMTVVAAPDRAGEPTRSWEASQAVLEPDPGFWRSQPVAPPHPARTYAVGMSDMIAMTRIGSKLERGDRLAFRSSVTIEVRNAGREPASLLVIAALPEGSLAGAPQG